MQTLQGTVDVAEFLLLSRDQFDEGRLSRFFVQGIGGVQFDYWSHVDFFVFCTFAIFVWEVIFCAVRRKLMNFIDKLLYKSE